MATDASSAGWASPAPRSKIGKLWPLDRACLGRIYVADIGDNGADRKRITVYRVADRAEASGSAKVGDIYHATYPDAFARCRSVAGRAGGAPAGRVGGPRDPGAPARNDRITDGAVSPDGEWIVLRSRQALTIYRAADLLAANWREAGRVTLESVGEPQGEGVTFASNDSVYLISEGGGKKRPGAFARLTCTLTP
jgi:hypothetical protein